MFCAFWHFFLILWIASMTYPLLHSLSWAEVNASQMAVWSPNLVNEGPKKLEKANGEAKEREWCGSLIKCGEQRWNIKQQKITPA